MGRPRERANAPRVASADPDDGSALWAALDRLDGRLLRLAEAVPGRPTSRGRPAALCQGLRGAAPFCALAAHYGLADADLDVLVVSLAPTVDLRYAAAYRAMRDHAVPRAPTVDLVLDILSGGGPDALDQRIRFATTGPLVGGGAVHLVPDDAEPSWLASYVEIDPQVVRLVHGDDDLDARLVSWCSLPGPVEAPLMSRLPPRLADLGRAAKVEPLCIHLQGPGAVDGDGRDIAHVLSAATGQRLLVADAGRLLDRETDAVAGVNLLLREAQLFRRTIVLEGVDALAVTPAWRSVLPALAQHRGWIVLSGSAPLPPAHGAGARLLTVAVPVPNALSRKQLWSDRLAANRVVAADEDVALTAGTFRLTAAQITDAAQSAAAELSFADAQRADRGVLFAAARAQSRPELASLAVQVDARATWADLVLPVDATEQLRELCYRVTLRDRVLDDWALGATMSRGSGVSALFVGPSGTGKTMAAEVVANELGLMLYRIDLAGVVSKYIGETEKNLDRIFAAARDANAVLLFDEADALFGKRSEVKDSHDRYANVEIAYLLQQLESHDGLAILTSNLPRNVDEAFVRRLSFTVHFPFPDEPARRLLWEQTFPAALPVAPDVDHDELARRFKVSGATIRNAVLAGAYRAAAADRAVGMADVLHGIRREFQKMGKALDDEQLGIST